jgi:multimeric flavodoxin WrbA
MEHEPDALLKDIEWADGIAFGTPTLAGNPRNGEGLVDKVSTAFTSSQSEHGGQE